LRFWRPILLPTLTAIFAIQFTFYPIVFAEQSAPQSKNTKNFDELFGDLMIKREHQILKRIVMNASHAHTIGDLIGRGPLLSLSLLPKLKTMASQPLPKMIYTSSGMTIFINEHRIKIEPMRDLFSFLIDGKVFKVNPSWSLDDIAEHLLDAGIGKNTGQQKHAVLSIFFPSAHALLWETGTLIALVIAYALYETAAWPIGFVLGCAIGVNQSSGKDDVIKACKENGEDISRVMLDMPQIVLPNATAPVFHEFEKMKSRFGREIECGTDGSFRVGNEKNNRPSMFYYDGTKREITFPRGSKFPIGTVKMDDLGPMFKKMAANSQIPDIEKKIDEAMIAAKKELVQMESNCLENPDTTFRITPTGLEKTRREIQRSSKFKMVL
jgi:hypothetical protein